MWPEHSRSVLVCTYSTAVMLRRVTFHVCLESQLSEVRKNVLLFFLYIIIFLLLSIKLLSMYQGIEVEIIIFPNPNCEGNRFSLQSGPKLKR